MTLNNTVYIKKTDKQTSEWVGEGGGGGRRLQAGKPDTQHTFVVRSRHYNADMTANRTQVTVTVIYRPSKQKLYSVP
jgi:hypothetical protein